MHYTQKVLEQIATGWMELIVASITLKIVLELEQLPSEKLEVIGNTKTNGFIMTTGAMQGYILVTDSNGVGTWQAPNTAGLIGATGATGSAGAQGPQGLQD